MKMDKPRPSSLPMLEACPRWEPRPKTEDGRAADDLDAAADEGTIVHAAMERLAQEPVETWDAVIDSDPAIGGAFTGVVRAAADAVRGVFGMGLPVTTAAGLGVKRYELKDCVADGETEPRDGVYCECGVDSGIALPGTADVVAVFGDCGDLVDYKTTRVERDHELQLFAYVLGVFNAVPRLRRLRARVVAPRLRGEPGEHEFRRDQIPELRRQIGDVLVRVADSYCPGRPGTQCAFCAGNGRCAWQAATLRDIPADVEALVVPGAWADVMAAGTIEARGQRRQLMTWLSRFVDAVKDDDKVWEKENPDTELPGFKKVKSVGRLALDRTRYRDANAAVMAEFAMTEAELLACAEPKVKAVAEAIAFTQALSDDAAQAAVKRALTPFMIRGDDIVSFRPLKKKAELTA